MKAVLEYLKRRFNERSTYMLIVAGIAGAAALMPPWSYVSVTVSVVAALVPDGGMKGG
jgi:hypothetical protein